MKVLALVFTGVHLRLKYFIGRASLLLVVLKNIFTLNNLAAKLQQKRWVKNTKAAKHSKEMSFLSFSPSSQKQWKAMDHEEKQFPTSGIKQCSLLYC